MDASRCPLCGGPNGCVMESADPQAKCWCMDEKFTRDLLARVPDEAKRKACICARCAKEALAPAKAG